MASDFKAAQPVEYYRRFLEKNVRPDERELREIRPTVLNTGSITTADGSALVKIGNTTVICGIKGELTSPKPEHPGKGFVVPNVDLSPLCSPIFRPGPPSEQAQVASQLIMDVINNSGCLPVERLCIKEGKHVWVLFCDLVCLNLDGNLHDAVVLSLLAALKNLTLPSVEFDAEQSELKIDTTVRCPVRIDSEPVATTFGIFDDTIIYADPTSEEEFIASGMITMVTLENDKICLLHKPGGSTVSDEKLQDCIKHSFSRAQEVRNLINEAFSEQSTSMAIDR